MHPIENFLCAALHGEYPAWPDTKEDISHFIKLSAYHGVQALLHEHIGLKRGIELGWPEAVLNACRQQAISQALWEMRHQHLLNQVLERLSAIGIQPILFKGTALAYNLYTEPFLRTRGDTDLIIPAQDCRRVVGLLETLGFKRGQGVTGEFISYQANYSRKESDGDTHTLDLHWRINNSELLSKLFTYEELRSHAQTLPKLGPNAIAAGPVDALMLACMHRMSHKHHPYHVGGTAYYGGDRLIWLYDIHLLVEALSPAQQEAFIEQIKRKGLRAVCWEGIEQTCACFPTHVPEMMRSALAHTGEAEPMASYLNGSGRYQQWADFQAIDGILNKLRFIAEVIFPPPSYMRYKYPIAHPNWLPWLYLRRIGTGLWKRFNIP